MLVDKERRRFVSAEVRGPGEDASWGGEPSMPASAARHAARRAPSAAGRAARAVLPGWCRSWCKAKWELVGELPMLPGAAAPHPRGGRAPVAPALLSK